MKYLFILLLLTSCGSRKVIIEKTQETKKIETKIVDNTRTIDTSDIDELEILPIDTLKPVIINGKSYFNAKIKHVKKKNYISVVADRITTTKAKETVIIKNKETVINYWWFLLILIIPAYFLYKLS